MTGANSNDRQKYPEDIDALLKDCTITNTTSSKKGGQRRDKKRTAIKIRHNPSGVTVSAQSSRKKSENLETAKANLLEKIKEHNRGPVERTTFSLPKEFRDHIEDGSRIICGKKDPDYSVVKQTVIDAIISSHGRTSYASDGLGVSMKSLINLIKRDRALLSGVNKIRKSHSRRPIV